MFHPCRHDTANIVHSREGRISTEDQLCRGRHRPAEEGQIHLGQYVIVGHHDGGGVDAGERVGREAGERGCVDGDAVEGSAGVARVGQVAVLQALADEPQGAVVEGLGKEEEWDSDV